MQEKLTEFKKNDKVYHNLYGNGVVTRVYTDTLYKVMVQFDKGDCVSFTQGGKFNIMDKEPSLFLRTLNLKELEDKLDKALEAETTESLTEFINSHRRIKPCQAHAFSDEGAESLEELNLELPLKCIHFKDYNLCSCKNICEQCKID